MTTCLIHDPCLLRGRHRLQSWMIQTLVWTALAMTTMDLRAAAGLTNPPAATVGRIGLSPAESAWLRLHPVWRVSADPAWPPFSLFDDATRWSGIDLDMIRLVAGKVGAQIELLPATSWPDLQERLKARNVDIATGTARNAERRETANFSDSYLSFPVAIITRDAAPFLVGLSALEGRKVAVPRDYITADLLTKDFPSVITVNATNAEHALKLLSRGEVDAVVENLAVASYFIRENRVGGLKIGGIAPFHFDLRFAVRKDWPELVGILNKGLAAIPQRDRGMLMDRWVTVDFQDSRGWRRFSVTLMLIAGIGGVALVLTLWWTRRLAWEVERRKQAERELIEEKRRAEQASRLKSDFLADMSHEIRNPLTAVLGNADLLGLDDLSERSRHCLNGIITGGQTLLGVVNDILDLSRIEAGRLRIAVKPVALSSLLYDTCQLYRRRAEQKGITLECKTEGVLPNEIQIDPLRLQQILGNAISNAIKFTDQGGVTLTARVEPGPAHETCRLLLSVRDTGIGIPKEEQSRIFEAFVQRDKQDERRYGGTGLGLAICKKLTELMGGTVELESEPGRGSVFLFNFPSMALRPEGEDPTERLDPGKLNQFDPMKVLVVDDDAMIRDVMRRYFQEGGHTVIEAATAAEAMILAVEHQPTLALLDYALPDRNGVELARHLRGNGITSSTRIVFVSGTMSIAELSAPDLQGYPLVQKPPTYRALVAAVQAVLATRRSAQAL